MIVDAHIHIWDPTTRHHHWLSGLGSLDAPFSLDDFAAATPTDVGKAILVQVLADEDETRELLARSASNPVIAGVVGWTDVAAPDVSSRIAALQEAPGGGRLVGIRHLVQSERDPDWLMRPEVLGGLAAVADAGLVYDLLVLPAQLPAALAAMRRIEHLSAVLDHAAKPVIADGALPPWASLVTDLGATGRVACKLSGLVTEAGPGFTAAMLQPFADHVLDAFGTDGVIFGSDWPVSSAVASYGEVVELARQLVAGTSPEEQAAIFGGNAIRVYRIE